MVPFHTILALLLVLVAVSSCSQMDPPHPDAAAKAAAQLESSHQSSNNSYPQESVDLSVQGTARINLTGYDAQTLYNLLWISPYNLPGTSALIKDGINLTCLDDSGNFSCGFPVNLDGTLKPLTNKVFPLKPLLDQSSITAPLPAGGTLEELPKNASPTKDDFYVRLYVAGDAAKTFYNAIQVTEVAGPASDKLLVNAEKDTDTFDCSRQVSRADHSESYFCDLYLDVTLGAIDKPSADKVYY